jgi:hypothetical protein
LICFFLHWGIVTPVQEGARDSEIGRQKGVAVSKRSMVLIAEMKRGVLFRSGILMGVALFALATCLRVAAQDIQSQSSKKDADRDAVADNAMRLTAQGRQAFALIRSATRRSWAIRSSCIKPSKDPSWAELVLGSVPNWPMKLDYRSM